MDEQHIILSFKGEISKELLTSIYSIMEVRMDKAREELQRKKKMYNILVESLQNIFHHLDDFEGNTEHSKTREAIFLVSFNKENGYEIHTGNYLYANQAESLRQKLEHINSMDAGQLKEYYRTKLNETSFSEKGGAGLGFIDMARKSGNKLDYKFHDGPGDLKFFTFSVRIN
ncbi:MAG: hypothetical protein DWQ44_01950 [Bacteroidetes bacterium]|nr:MAG: hypothetical protein DWQ33_05680 [Bacteroidota bacterium]REK04740.1 MAG: hypothetical protein DWQ39_05845 [Bacteroidota bacterium]REK36214.1 MAG: hypothetical protein DWQ44_01950 [Bacteroidota bacterium]REK51415.1 MAG: hypothetical protein DWQ48_00885 [Bacteroidota bacterium]